MRTSSAQPRTVVKSAGSSGSVIGAAPSSTCPAVPSRVTMSPAFRIMPPADIVPVRSSTRISPAPVTQGLPRPRATTAAWLVRPPRAVRMPVAACIPWISSGLVSTRTRMTFFPSPASRSASFGEKVISPQAAPGDAGRPLAMTQRWNAGSIIGWRSSSRRSGGTCRSASFLVSDPASTLPTRMRRSVRARLGGGACSPAGRSGNESFLPSSTAFSLRTSCSPARSRRCG